MKKFLILTVSAILLLSAISAFAAPAQGSDSAPQSSTPEATIVRIPDFLAVSSGYVKHDNLWGFLDEVKPAKLALEEIILGSSDILLHGANDKFNWLWAVADGDDTKKQPSSDDIVEFKGGLYAAATSIDGDTKSLTKVDAKIKAWLETTGFEVDLSRGHTRITHMLYADAADDVKEGLGYEQLQVYIPVKLKQK
ncbi:MAG: hypothetical protein LBS21_00990 [Clostridiales bacterium]|jgi:hypothetical protein|nr:hypothetical protein [Clostridiales bacterium]